MNIKHFLKKSYRVRSEVKSNDGARGNCLYFREEKNISKVDEISESIRKLIKLLK
jgi:hypothetical protein